MMKRLLSCSGIILATCFSVIQAQTPFNPCGTTPHKDEWYHRYLSDRMAFQSLDRGANDLFIPVTVHMVGTDAGTGYFSPSAMLETFCRLNEAYESANIHFFIEGEVNYINNTGLYDHSDIVDGANYMFQYNRPNTMNSYIVSDPAGNCGYNMRYAGNMIAHGCMDGNTWAHETGHYFNCQHPFIGWEGRTYSYNTPTPDTLTYDYTNFRDTLWGNDTTIIDTTEAELVDRSNCQWAADGLCDTESDYLAYRWPCDVNGISQALQKDPDGTDFRSDGSLIMSYSFSECQARFSNDQINLIRSYILTERPNLLYNNNPMRDTIMDFAQAVSPAPAGFVDAGNVLFTWHPVDLATHYVVQVSPSSSFGVILEEVIVNDTFFQSSRNYTVIPNPNMHYWWRVKAYNPGYTCAPFSGSFYFNTQTPASVTHLDAVSELICYPQPVTGESNLTVAFIAGNTGAYQIQVTDIMGRVLYTSALETAAYTQTTTDIPTDRLSAGMYFVSIKAPNGGVTTEKFRVLK